MAAHRPGLIVYASVAELYGHFHRLFLAGQESANELQSNCGQVLSIYDHHFFHMVKLDEPNKDKLLLMKNEKSTIVATNVAFGLYTHDKQRAIYLASAAVCLQYPDEVWEDPELVSAKWIYIKEFDASPYRFTIVLVGERGRGKVLVTSFPGKTRDARKWRRGTRIYP